MRARVLALLAALSGVPLRAQDAHHPWIRVAAQAIPILSRSDAVPGGTAFAELRLAQPVLMAQAGALADRLRLDAMFDFEGLTIPNGELTPGAYGEGFYDRRHPHTYVHELMLSAPDLLRDVTGSVQLSLAAGKGFAPFGSDDPMSRPPLLYPVNHHLSQILERAVGVVTVRTAGVTAEAGLFDGDEPERPAQWPNVGRFGDSWAARLTVRPREGLEWQTSRAHVHSPEHRQGAGIDAEKWSVSLRWEGGPGYGLAEWARTSEAGGSYVFHSLLAEGGWRHRRHRPYLRFERTERPEEQRISDDQFRSTRPHNDNTILGVTRWTIGTFGYGYAASAGRLTLQPTVELAVAGVAQVGGGIFDPAVFYGRRTLYSLSLGVRIDWGMMGHRMGHYGSAMPASGAMAMPGMDSTSSEAR